MKLKLTDTVPQAGKQTPDPLVQDWVSTVLQDNNVTVDYKATEFRTATDSFDDDELIATLNILAQNRGSRYGKDRIKDVLTCWTAEQRRAKLVAIRQSINWSPSALFDFNTLLRLILKEVRPLDVAVLQQWIWQVKRKINGLPVKYPLFVNFYGDTQSGKTWVIQDKIAQPLKEVFTVASLRLFEDKWAYRTTQYSFIVFFDELAYLERADENMLKQVISQDRMDGRGCGNDRLVSVRQNASFISTSNTPLNTLLRDSTSARRFFEFECLPKDSLQKNWETLDNLDYVAMWQTVDERNQTAPILPFVNEMNEIQSNNLRPKSVEEEFLEECTIIDPQGRKSCTEIHIRFIQWLSNKGQKWSPPTPDKLGRKLIGLQVPCTLVHGKNMYHLSFFDDPRYIAGKALDDLRDKTRSREPF